MAMNGSLSPFMLLLNRTEEKMSKGVLHRHEPIEERYRTRHRFAWTDTAARGDLSRIPSPLGLGYLQAVLSVLRLFPLHVSYDVPGLVGRVDAKGTEMYHLSWNETDGVACRQGGFVFGGKPNYHAAVLGLTQAIVMYLSGERLQSGEVFEGWCALLQAMDTEYRRTSREWGWPESAVADACAHPQIRELILRVCDALRAAMQYHLAAKSRREVLVFEDTVAEPDEGTALALEGWKLLDVTWLEAKASSVPLLPTPRPIESTPDSVEKKTGSSELPVPPLPPKEASSGTKASGGSVGTARSATAVKPTAATSKTSPTGPGMPPLASRPPSWAGSRGRTSTTPTVLAGVVGGATEASRKKAPEYPRDPEEDLYGPYVDAVSQALAQGGSILLVGPTGTGKSSLILDAAIRNEWGVELIVCHEGKRIHVLQGGHAREAEKGEDWRFAAGPITRLAKRIQGGERVVLILDELARAHKEVFAYAMDLLNTYSTREVQAMIPTSDSDDMQLELPSDFGEISGGRYHILAVDILQRRYAIPTTRLLVAATANQGEQYQGNAFADPAFCRRWTHWLHLAEYDETVMRQILASKCALPPSATLFDAILQVSREVHTYHTREDALKMTLSLPLLINWARQTMWYYYDLRSKTRSNLQKSFEIAARNAWLSRICPYQGAKLDLDVESILLGYVSAPTLHKLK
jgi:hypothetical protein